MMRSAIGIRLFLWNLNFLLNNIPKILPPVRIIMENPGEWNGEFDDLADPEETRVISAALDSFR